MKKITDDQVFDAIEAYAAERQAWRVIEFPFGAIATDVHRPAPLILNGPIPETTSYEKHEFKDKESAQQYASFRAMRAALESLRATR